MRVLLLAFTLLSLASLAACSTDPQVPIGAGGDMDELRKSPCACGPVILERTQWVG